MITFSHNTADGFPVSQLVGSTKRLRSGRELLDRTRQISIESSSHRKKKSSHPISANKFYGRANRFTNKQESSNICKQRNRGAKNRHQPRFQRSLRSNSSRNYLDGLKLVNNQRNKTPVLKCPARLQSVQKSVSKQENKKISAESREDFTKKIQSVRLKNVRYKFPYSNKNQRKLCSRVYDSTLNDEIFVSRSPRIAGLVARAKLKHFLCSSYSPRSNKKKIDSNSKKSFPSDSGERPAALVHNTTESTSHNSQDSSHHETTCLIKTTSKKRKADSSEVNLSKYMMTRRRTRLALRVESESSDLHVDKIPSGYTPVDMASAKVDNSNSGYTNTNSALHYSSFPGIHSVNDSVLSSDDTATTDELKEIVALYEPFSHTPSDEDSLDSGCVCPRSPELQETNLVEILHNTSDGASAASSVTASPTYDQNVTSSLQEVEFSPCDLAPLNFETFQAHCKKKSLEQSMCQSPCNKTSVCLHSPLKLASSALGSCSSKNLESTDSSERAFVKPVISVQEEHASTTPIEVNLNVLDEAISFGAAACPSSSFYSIQGNELSRNADENTESEGEIGIECSADVEQGSEVVILIDENKNVESLELCNNCDVNDLIGKASIGFENEVSGESTNGAVNGNIENLIANESGRNPTDSSGTDYEAFPSSPDATVAASLDISSIEHFTTAVDDFEFDIGDCDLDVRNFSSLIENVNLDQFSQGIADILPQETSTKETRSSRTRNEGIANDSTNSFGMSSMHTLSTSSGAGISGGINNSRSIREASGGKIGGGPRQIADNSSYSPQTTQLSEHASSSTAAHVGEREDSTRSRSLTKPNTSQLCVRDRSEFALSVDTLTTSVSSAASPPLPPYHSSSSSLTSSSLTSVSSSVPSTSSLQLSTSSSLSSASSLLPTINSSLPFTSFSLPSTSSSLPSTNSSMPPASSSLPSTSSSLPVTSSLLPSTSSSLPCTSSLFPSSSFSLPSTSSSLASTGSSLPSTSSSLPSTSVSFPTAISASAPTYDPLWVPQSSASAFSGGSASFSYSQNTDRYSSYPTMSSSAPYQWYQSSYWSAVSNSWMAPSYYSHANQPWYSNLNRLWPTIGSNAWGSSWNGYGSPTQTSRDPRNQEPVACTGRVYREVSAGTVCRDCVLGLCVGIVCCDCVLGLCVGTVCRDCVLKCAHISAKKKENQVKREQKNDKDGDRRADGKETAARGAVGAPVTNEYSTPAHPVLILPRTTALSGSETVQRTTALSGSEAVRRTTALPGSEAVQRTTALPGSEAVQRTTALSGSEAVQRITALPGTEAVQRTTALPGSETVQRTTALPGSETVQRTTALPGSEAVQRTTALPGTEAVQRTTALPGSEAVQRTTALPGSEAVQRTTALPGSEAVQRTTGVPGNAFSKIFHR
ncbi:hypothetical protein FHG87_004915 [Trinorchestia longiramus]|nr:hypothetical protein FHG87_004915 [Trinorchestia longiramus]